MGLEELLKNQQQLTAAAQIIKKTFDETMAHYQENESKLLAALESVQQRQAMNIKDLGAVLDGIINR
jgi:hypothetical protein